MSTLGFDALATREIAQSPELFALQEGQNLGRFTARALFTDAGDQPIGAGFVHESGMTVDVLYFASVPQASITVRTLPVSDKGESHTGEHLLIGKGTKGGYINALLGMRLAEHTAGTYKDATNYQFVCAAGMDGFFELLEAYLGALIQPDFTDEEIRREVANFEAVPDRDGRLHLQEKGTVYNEMVSTMEKANARAWYQLERLVFGESHPIARIAGGDPAGIRALTPEEVRRFLGSRYHIGPNLSLVIALPLGQPLETQISRLEAVVARIEPEPPALEREKVPPSSPGRRGEIRIGSFSSDDPNLPQNVLLGFSPLENASALDLLRAQLVLGLIGGGETSYLHQDLVDRATRNTDVGITAVWTWLDSPPLAYPVIGLSGLPPRFIEMKTLAALREQVLSRIRWLASLEPGSKDLAQAVDKARSSVRSARRGYLRFTDAPPHFGARHGGGIAWQRHLDLLADQPGFRKVVPLSDALDQIERELGSGENPFRAAVERAGLAETPWVSAVKADATQLQRELEGREERLVAEVARLDAQYRTKDAQEALKRFQADTEAKTREIEARHASIGKPRFIDHPPLTLDDLDFETARLPSGKQLVRATFGTTSFTRIALDFDLTALPLDAIELLPILPEVLTDLGAIAPDGEKLDYVHADERIRSEIFNLGAQLSANPATGRAELELSAGASTPDEVDRALAWLESYLFEPVLAADSQKRLLDLISRALKSGREIFQAAEEMWVQGAATAYVYENQPVYMALASPFTRLRYLARARARLDDANAATRAARREAIERVEAVVQSGDRQQIAAALGDLGAELADDFRFELDHLPDDRLATDLTRLVREARADLAVAPEKTIARLKQLLSSVIVQDGVRVSLTGRSADLARAERGVRKLLARLPAGSARGSAPVRVPIVSHRLAERYPGVTPETRPVHVALVNNGTSTATHVVIAPASSWRSRGLNDVVDRLAAGVLAGAGPHALFMRTWAAGLAYSNGLRASTDAAQVIYYAERCPDPVEIMRFVADIASHQTVDRDLVEYALADAFGDYRADQDFFARGSAIANNLADGTTPEVVRDFKQRLIKAAHDPEAAAMIAARLPDAVGRVIVGYGEKVSSVRGAVGFVVAPEPLIARYEQHLVEIGEADRIVRLYPRDFWPDPDPALPLDR